MDRIKLLKTLDQLSSILQKRRLHFISKLGRHLVTLIFKGKLSIKVDSLSIYGSLEHWSYLYSLQRGQQGEEYRVSLFKQVIKPGTVVLDIGAYLGRFSLIAAQKIGPSGKVYAFEPDARSFQMLVQNIWTNGFTDRVVAVPKAVSDRNGVQTFYLCDWPLCRSSLFFSRGATKRVSVECISIDDFVDESMPIGVIKMDIEGAELHALKGLEQVISRASRDLTIFAECNPLKLYAAGSSPQALLTRLREFGFNIKFIDEKQRCLSPVSPNIESLKGFLYCTRRQT